MRPISLTMSAFGPYSQREIIDFRLLGDRNLFLITGPTGAGKTTIFDAISFALFGKASGELRSEESLRSHFATVDIVTEIGLTFELKDMTYHITRRPRQERPKKRGEGMVLDQAKATLIMEDGEPRTVIEGHGKVTEKIEEILGINEQQFKQIMMIPQGEFRKLLVADSKDREKVLRQLFDTYIYRQIQMDLDEQSKTLFKQISTEKTIISGMLSGIKYDENDRLQELIDSDYSDVEQILEAITGQIRSDKAALKVQTDLAGITEKKINQEINQRNEAQTDNKNLGQLDEARKKLEETKGLEPSMDRKKEELAQARKAAKLMPLEQNLTSKQERLQQLSARAEALALELELQTTTLKKTEVILDEHQSSDYVEGLKAEQTEKIRLTSLLEKVRSLDQLAQAQKEALVSLETMLKSIDVNATSLDQLLLDLNANQIFYKKTSDVAVRLEQKKTAYEKAKILQGQLEKLQTQFKDLEQESVAIEKEDEACGVLEVNESNTETAYKKLKLLFLQNQAAILAKELEKDLPCPVCGSTKHPKPAEAIGDIITEEALELLEDRLKIAQKKTETAKTSYAARVSGYKSRFQGLMDQIGDIGIDIAPRFEVGSEVAIILLKALDESSEQVTTLMAEKDQLLNEQQRYKELSDRILKQEEEKELLEKEGTNLVAKKNELMVTKAELDIKLDQIYLEVPEEVRTLSALKLAIETITKTISVKEEATELAIKNHTKASQKHIKLQTELEQVRKHIFVNTEEIVDLQKEFDDRLVSAGFGADTEEVYLLAKRSEEQMQAIENELKVYHDSLIALQTIMQELEKTTKGKALVNIESHDETIEELKKLRNEQTDLQGIIQARITDNKDIKSRVKTSNNRIKDKSDQYSIIGDLARVAQGNNKAMMTFERFVLARFFEDIITAANIRLKQMTQNRYELLRSLDVQHRARQSGLELNVIDHFTGKPRHVKTLSGGESFKASLSMALGLSDVVQSYAGGVRLDTMFIDEGFGTLDQESLDSAINCLIDLQKSGRLVGIISHVQELKERVDTRLEVHSGNLGSTCGFVVG